MESVNQGASGNLMTLHTTGGCSMSSVRRQMTGMAQHTDCNNATDSNAGCGVQSPSDTFGAAYNDADGGYMAVEWRPEGIRMWEFRRNALPADIQAKKPDPSTWGEAASDFPNTKCDVSSHFRNQSLIANIDLCGQYAGGVYTEDGCKSFHSLSFSLSFLPR